MSAEVWMGYLLDHQPAFTVVQSPFVHEGERVFGADSDATTLAVASILHRLQHDNVTHVSVPEGINAATVAVATGVSLHDDDEHPATWDLLLSDEATVVLARHDADVELAAMDVEIEVDSEFKQAMDMAWEQELQHHHVSQGAYVSQAQYEEAARPRLLLEGQHGEQGAVWPPRYSPHSNERVPAPLRLARVGRVQTWTTLSAAGAPSEFALRAPVLGGISTVLLHLEDGPNGVFLVVDDEEFTPEMDGRMELVLRRIYAQEGFIRYGLKARPIHQ
jgi:uncharacterized OB-fold protein